jgi:hypothetical protein
MNTVLFLIMFNYKCKKNNRIEEGNSHRNIIIDVVISNLDHGEVYNIMW